MTFRPDSAATLTTNRWWWWRSLTVDGGRRPV